MGEKFKPEEAAFFKKGDEMTAENEALARGEKTVAAKKAKAIEANSDEWFKGDKPEDTEKF